MTVSSALLNNKPDRAEKRIRNSPHCIGCWTASGLFAKDAIDVLYFEDPSSDVNKALTELKSSTGVSGVNDANAVDNISRTWKKCYILTCTK